MTREDIEIREKATGLEVRLHVSPRAKRSEIAGVHNRALRVKVTAPPVDDAANRAIIELISARLGVPKSSLSIASGLRSREKILSIKGLSLEGFLERLKAS